MGEATEGTGEPLPFGDRLFNTRDACKFLGGISEREVRRLISDGRLRAVSHQLRGEGRRPRKFVKASEIRRYINGLCDVPSACDVPPPKKPRRRPGRGALANVKQFLD